MKYLDGIEEQEAIGFYRLAAEVAKKSTCRQSHCGSVIVKDGQVIGEGYNSPPLDKEENRRCGWPYRQDVKPRFDKTCCIHAEWRAILDACKRHPQEISGSRLYFMRLDDQGVMTRSGEPYCTTCSRLAMESGIAEFSLWQEQGIAVWPTDEYDRVSYEFFKE